MAQICFNPETEEELFQSKYLHKMLNLVANKFASEVEIHQFGKLLFSITEEIPWDLTALGLDIATKKSRLEKLSTTILNIADNKKNKLIELQQTMQDELLRDIQKENELSLLLDAKIAEMRIQLERFPNEFTSDRLLNRCMNRER